MSIFGLLTRRGHLFESVDLESTRAKVTIHGFVGHLSITLGYRNMSHECLQVEYVCPVDAKAAVYHFEAKIEGRRILGHCLEKEKAREVYKNAVQQGYTAILGGEDEMSGDVLHLSLGNILPGQTVELLLKMVIELPINIDGSITFKLPTVFNPRYSPPNQPMGPSFLPSGPSAKVFTNRTKYSLDVQGEVRGTFKIAQITSATDTINVRLSDEDTTALISQSGRSDYNHDFSFQVYYHSVHKAHALQMSGNRSCEGFMKDDILMLNFFPEIPMDSFSPHNELIFVVDRSGSMNGNKIIQARNTLLLFLKSLPQGCRFNILSFGSSYTSLFESSSERYTEHTLAMALELQKSLAADMGGTEILSVLQYVYSRDLIPGYARQMIVLTDGEVWNQRAIFDLVSRHAHETRVFSVGIGHGASTALVQGIAEAGKGRHEMVFHDNQLQMKVMGLVASMLQENVQDLQIDCEVNPSQRLILVPKVLPVIFGGQHLILYSRVTPKAEIKSIKMSWKIGDNKIECEIEANDCKIIHDSNFIFHRLAAKAQLKQWEREDIDRTQKDSILLSISSNVVCKATSFVGIDQDKNIIREGLKPKTPFVFSNQLFSNSGYVPLRSYMSQRAPYHAQQGMRQSAFNNFHQQPIPCGSFGFGSTSFGNSSQTFQCSSSTSGNRTLTSGSSSNPTFGSSSNPTFGSSSNQTFGSSSNPTFGSSSNQTFGSSSNPTFGSSSNQTFGSSSNPTFGSSTNIGVSKAPGFESSYSTSGNEGFGFGSTTLGNETPMYTAQSRSCEKKVPHSAPKAFGGETPSFSFSGHGANAKNESSVEEENYSKDDLILIVEAQKFDGSWSISDSIKIGNVPKDQLLQYQSQLSLDNDCFATALILALLEDKFMARRQEWNLVSIKGHMYLKSKNVDATKVIKYLRGL